jgi:type VI secretion system protein VasD
MRLPVQPFRSVFMTLSTCVLAGTLLLAGCASDTEKEVVREPVRLNLTIRTASSVNPDDQKRAAPIIVRLYELKNPDTFDAADFFSLQDKDKTLLGDDMNAREQFQMRPGDSKAIRRDAKSTTTTLGIIAAYRDLPNSVWRATWPMPPAPSAAWYHFKPKLKLTIDLDTNAIRIIDPTASEPSRVEKDVKTPKVKKPDIEKPDVPTTPTSGNPISTPQNTNPITPH